MLPAGAYHVMSANDTQTCYALGVIYIVVHSLLLESGAHHLQHVSFLIIDSRAYMLDTILDNHIFRICDILCVTSWIPCFNFFCYFRNIEVCVFV
jgi:hypothetical protein